MWFVSAPSLVISFVLAAFYVVSLVFYAVNRQHEKDSDNANEIVTLSLKNEPCLQQTVVLGVSQTDYEKFSVFSFQFSVFSFSFFSFRFSLFAFQFSF